MDWVSAAGQMDDDAPAEPASQAQGSSPSPAALLCELCGCNAKEPCMERHNVPSHMMITDISCTFLQAPPSPLAGVRFSPLPRFLRQDKLTLLVRKNSPLR